MTAKLTWTQAVQHMAGDESRLTQYLKGDVESDHPVFDMYLPISDGMMRSRITSRYTTASYDAWDSATIPPYVQFYLFCMLLGAATAHDEQRPELINAYASAASDWLDDIQSGRARIAELDEITSAVSNSTGGASARVGTGSRQDAYNNVVAGFKKRTERL